MGGLLKSLGAIAVTGLSAWTLAGLAGASTGRASAAPRITAGSRYLALGDSVTFGYQEPNVVPAPRYRNAGSFVAYPELLGRELHLTVANLSCPGESSASLIKPSAPSNGCENFPGAPHNGYRTAFPLHVRYRGAQLGFALHYLRIHRDVTLVSLMIGANDAFLCSETTRDHCASASERAGLEQRVTHNVRQILGAIRHAAHYRGQLAIVNYYALSPHAARTSRLINRVVDAAAKPFRVVVANGYAQFARASRHSADSPCTAGLLTQLGSPQRCGIHPSYAGQALLAQALEEAVRVG